MNAIDGTTPPGGQFRLPPGYNPLPFLLRQYNVTLPPGVEVPQLTGDMLRKFILFYDKWTLTRTFMSGFSIAVAFISVCVSLANLNKRRDRRRLYLLAASLSSLLFCNVYATVSNDPTTVSYLDYYLSWFSVSACAGLIALSSLERFAVVIESPMRRRRLKIGAFLVNIIYVALLLTFGIKEISSSQNVALVRYSMPLAYSWIFFPLQSIVFGLGLFGWRMHSKIKQYRKSLLIKRRLAHDEAEMKLRTVVGVSTFVLVCFLLLWALFIYGIAGLQDTRWQNAVAVCSISTICLLENLVERLTATVIDAQKSLLPSRNNIPWPSPSPVMQQNANVAEEMGPQVENYRMIASPMLATPARTFLKS